VQWSEVGEVFYDGGLFSDGEVRQVKDLTDLNHVTFLGGTTLRPFHELFFGVGFHQPITAQHFLRLDERPIGHRRLSVAERDPRAGAQRMKAVQRQDLDGFAQLFIEAAHRLHFLGVGHKAGGHLVVSVNTGDHQHHELHGSAPGFFLLRSFGPENESFGDWQIRRIFEIFLFGLLEHAWSRFGISGERTIA
jgi:hypothetical protein